MVQLNYAKLYTSELDKLSKLAKLGDIMSKSTLETKGHQDSGVWCLPTQGVLPDK